MIDAKKVSVLTQKERDAFCHLKDLRQIGFQIGTNLGLATFWSIIVISLN